MFSGSSDSSESEAGSADHVGAVESSSEGDWLALVQSHNMFLFYVFIIFIAFFLAYKYHRRTQIEEIEIEEIELSGKIKISWHMFCLLTNFMTSINFFIQPWKWVHDKLTAE